MAVSGACPNLPEYDDATQDKAASEVEALPEGTVLGGIFMPDYKGMRAAVRECIKARDAH